MTMLKCPSWLPCCIEQVHALNAMWLIFRLVSFPNSGIKAFIQIIDMVRFSATYVPG